MSYCLDGQIGLVLPALTSTGFRISSGGTESVQTIVVTPTDLAFGTVLVAKLRDSEVTISNTGTVDLAINTMTITGTNSQRVSGQPAGPVEPTFPINLAASGVALQNVTFTPTSVGAKSANLAISSNDGDTPTVNVDLRSGTGDSSPNIAVSPATLSFGSKSW